MNWYRHVPCDINDQVVTLLFDRVNADDEAAAIAAATASATASASNSTITNPSASASAASAAAAAAAAIAADIQPRGSRRVRRVDAAAVCARQQQLMQQAAEPHSPAPEQQHALQCMSRTARCCWLLLHDLCLLCAGEHSLHDSLWLKLSAQLPVAVALELLEAVLTQARRAVRMRGQPLPPKPEIVIFISNFQHPPQTFSVRLSAVLLRC